jgi:SRSO17 transposase
LPKAWTDDPARMKAAHVPAETRFATKPAMAGAMIARALAAKVPFGWVAADSVYGVGSLEATLRRAGKGYVLGVSCDHRVNSWGKDSWGQARPIAGTAGAVAQGLSPSDWVRLSAGEGTKGARLHDWAYLELADLDIADDDASRSGPSERLPLTINVRSSERMPPETNACLWTRGLLVRRKIADGDLAFFSTWCPAGTPIETLVKVEGHRWAIEDSFETAKNELGLDHNETRSWHGWHRHVSLVMLAFAMMAVIRHRANSAAPQKMNPAKTLRRWRHAP